MNPAKGAFGNWDYDPFGMVLVGRNWEVESGYRYGFNGKEQDSETYGSGNIYDYGFRIYNPRIGKFLSVDPLTKNYPSLTPYQFASNTPIIAIDLDGAEAVVVNIRPVPGFPALTQVNVIKVMSQVQQPTLQVTYNYYDAAGNITSTNTTNAFIPGSVEEQLATATDASGNTGLSRLTSITPNSQPAYSPGWSYTSNPVQDPQANVATGPFALNGFQYDLNVQYNPDGYQLNGTDLARTNTPADVQTKLSTAASTLSNPVPISGIGGGTANLIPSRWNITVVGETDGSTSNHTAQTTPNTQPSGNPALAQDRANVLANALGALMPGITINTAIVTNSGNASQTNRNTHINIANL